MGEASEGRNQRDLLQRFMSPEKSMVVVGDGEVSEEVELNLGLSLGGRFGVDKSSKKLIRSSSLVAGTIPPACSPAGSPAMYRTSSLPVETEEQWRKRKELQSLRRMEAKRRRSEKQRSSSAAARDGLAAGSEEGSTPPPFGIPSWAAAAAGKSVAAGAGRSVPPVSRGSPESQGGSSSGNSEPESKMARGSNSHDETKSPESGNRDSARASWTNSRTFKPEMGNSPKKPEIGIGATGDMPSVFTKGDGPDGRRVDGILYKYGKGEEVRIMCVCHGSFLSPADFVKHAGGGEVANPLRHIVINHSASSSL